MKRNFIRIVSASFVLTSLLAITGCSMFQNSDESLRKPTEEFAADAAKRAYPATAPRDDSADAVARSQVNYGIFNILDVTNVTDNDLTNVEIWVNHRYVVFVPKMEGKTDKRLSFDMLYDQDGHPLTLTNAQPKIDTVEIFTNGKFYNVPVVLAD